MAAKVVMVAVPTVLGIASIHVCKDNEAPIDGLIGREKLSIYNPLPQSPRFRFVTEKPGVLQSGFTDLRESVLPYFWALQDACVSVKNGSINLYHAGEDVYHYLKDPPPGFLPRLSTITLAGLLGMFLAQKGSRLKRVALPLGMMSAGASVCYPAQTVAVLKVTGKKMYAAGQWSGTTVSSLFTSKPKEQVSKELVSPKSEPATLPKPDSPVEDEIPHAPCHAPEPTSTSDEPAQTMPSLDLEMVVESLQSESLPAAEELHNRVDSKEPTEMKQTPEVASTESSPVETMATSATEEVEQSVPPVFTPDSKEPPAPERVELTLETVVESTPAESVLAPEQLASPVEIEDPLAPTQALTESSSATYEESNSAIEETSDLMQMPPLPEEFMTETPTETVIESTPAESLPAPEQLSTPVENEQPLAPTQALTDSTSTANEESTAVVEETSDLMHMLPLPEEAMTETPTETVVESIPAESVLAPEQLFAPVESEEPLASTQALADSTSVDDEAPTPVIEEPSALTQMPTTTQQAMTETPTETMVESTPAESVPAPEQLSAPIENEEPLAPIQPLSDSTSNADEAPTAVVEELSALTDTPPPPQQATTETPTGGSGFNADPALVDYGQSNPEDEDLYSTRS